jgi:hypothetical protein
MKAFIRNKFRRLIFEQMIDGQEMNAGTQSLCNTMTVNSYDEVIGRLIHAIGPKDKNPELWAKIQKPLSMLKKANFDLNKEKHTNSDGTLNKNGDGMTGDSIPDEATTWWAAIQSTICEQGPEFQ